MQGVLAPPAREAVDLRGLQAARGRVAVGRAIARAAATRVDVPRAPLELVRVALVAIAPLAARMVARPVVRHVSGKIAARGRLDLEPVTPELVPPGLVAPIVVTVRRVSGKTVARVLVPPGLVARKVNARLASVVLRRAVDSDGVRVATIVRPVSGKTVARVLVPPGLVAPIVVTVRPVSGKTVARVLVAPGLVALIVVTVRHVSGKIAAPELVDLVRVAPGLVAPKVNARLGSAVPRRAVASVGVRVATIVRPVSGKIAAPELVDLVRVAPGPVAPAAPDVRNRRPVPFLVGRMVLSDVRSASRSVARSDVAIEPVTMARSNVPSSIPRLTVRRSTPIERSGSTRVLSVMLLEAQRIRVAPNLRIVTAALSGARARSTPMTANRRIDPPRSRLQASHRNGRAP